MQRSRRGSILRRICACCPTPRKAGSNKGSRISTISSRHQTGIDLRSPYSWFLASTPYDPSPNALFPEAQPQQQRGLRQEPRPAELVLYRPPVHPAQLVDVPGYIKSDLKQLSNPYVREVTSREIFPGREIGYGESPNIQTLNLSFYPDERGPYNLDN